MQKQQIASSIPDSLFLKIRSNGSAFRIWKALGDHFEKRSQMVAIDLRRCIQNQRCGDKDDIVTHFTMLCTMREDLAAMGQKLEDSDFYAIVMGSLYFSRKRHLECPGDNTNSRRPHVDCDRRI